MFIEAFQAQQCAEVADILQIPAFLCRQTDLLVACAETGKLLISRKGSLWLRDMQCAVEKIQDSGNEKVMLTERGTSFGYHNLVVDMRGLATMRGNGGAGGI